MGQMQWLGSMPAKRTGWSDLAGAVRGGTTGYIAGRERAEEMGLKKSEQKIDLEKINYTKRKDAVEMLRKMRDQLDDEKWQILVNDPQTAELIASVYGETGLNAFRNMKKEISPYEKTLQQERAKNLGLQEYQKQSEGGVGAFFGGLGGKLGSFINSLRGQGNVPAGTASDPLGLRR